jgi:hypothetical protein
MILRKFVFGLVALVFTVALAVADGSMHCGNS